VKEIFRNGQPFHHDRVATVMGPEISQSVTYELLEHLFWLRPSINKIPACIEKHQGTLLSHTNPCIEMLDDEISTAQDVIVARHASVLQGIANLLDAPWPEKWESDFSSIMALGTDELW
jgi:hypothetical protein